MKLLLILMTMFAGLVPTSSANEITAKVVSVIDGNTIEINSGENGKQVVVLFGVDAPEMDQEFGAEARSFVSKLLLNKTVKVVFKGKDRVGNFVALVLINDDDVRVPILKEGYGWLAEKNRDENLEPYVTWAQKKGKGLWKNPNAVAPWTFRRQQSMMQPKSS